jgi:hypothetical protein
MDPNEQLNRILELCEEIDELTEGAPFNPYKELADRIKDLHVHLSNNGGFPDAWEHGSDGVGRWSPASAGTTEQPDAHVVGYVQPNDGMSSGYYKYVEE